NCRKINKKTTEKENDAASSLSCLRHHVRIRHCLRAASPPGTASTLAAAATATAAAATRDGTDPSQPQPLGRSHACATSHPFRFRFLID
uniref:Uncharacterized protein n=1 Tax=Oryza punctata TaxID=4537 RepID=A0A0E0LYZ0_ORYPU